MGAEPAWSPDGERLAFAWHDTVSVIELRSKLTIEVVDDAHEPAWSPDGRYLAVTSRARGIFLVDLEGSKGTRRITRNALDRDPCWNPTTGELTFVRRDAKRLSTLLVSMNTKTRRERRLTSGKFYDNGPAWSSDGRYVAFSRSPASVTLDSLREEEIFVLDRVAKRLRQLTRNEVPDGGAAWIP